MSVHCDLLRRSVRTDRAGEGLLAGVGTDVAAEVVAAAEGLSAEGTRSEPDLARMQHGRGAQGGRRQEGFRLLQELELQQRRSEGHILQASLRRSSGEMSAGSEGK